MFKRLVVFVVAALASCTPQRKPAESPPSTQPGYGTVIAGPENGGTGQFHMSPLKPGDLPGERTEAPPLRGGPTIIHPPTINDVVGLTAALAAKANTPIDFTGITNLPVVEVKAYGAVGDGVTNDGPAIQSAINAAALKGGNAYKGGAVHFSTGTYLIQAPIVLPRTGNGQTPIVHLIGDDRITCMILGGSSFPPNRGLVEWAATTSTVWGGRIARLGFRTPDNVAGVRCIWHKSNKTGGLQAAGTTINDVMAEWFQCGLEDLRLEGNNQRNEYLIDLEVGDRGALIQNLIGDPWRGLVVGVDQPPYVATTYDTMLLHVADSYGGVDAPEGEDSVGLGMCEIRQIQPMMLRGGWVRTFKGRVYMSNWSGSFNNGPMPGRAGAYGYDFRNCWGTKFENMNSEGGSGDAQYNFYKCRDLRLKNFTVPVGTVPSSAAPIWVANTAYTAGTIVAPVLLVQTTNFAPANRVYTAQNNGTSAATEPNWAAAATAGATILDGGVTWTASQGNGVSNGVRLESCEGLTFEGNYTNPGSPTPSGRLTKNVIIDANSRNNKFTKWTIRGTVTGGANTVNTDALPELSVQGQGNSVSGELVQSFGGYRLPFNVGLNPEQLPALANYRGDDDLLEMPNTLNGGAWGPFGLTGVTADATTDPWGVQRADKIVEGVGAAQHGLAQTAVRGNVAKQQTWSVCMKAAERTTAALTLTDNVGFMTLACDLRTGTHTPSVIAEAGMSLDSHGAVNMGGGWWRFWITGTLPAATANSTCYIYPNTTFYTGDGTSGIYAFGAQLENAAQPGPIREPNPTFYVGVDPQVLRMDAAMRGNRNIAFSTAGAYNGAWFEIVQNGAGAFTRDIGGLKTIPASTNAKVRVTYDGVAWRLTDYAADTDSAILLRSLTTHTHTYNDGSLIGFGTAASKVAGNAVGNVPLVESDGKLNASILRAGANQTWTVTNQAAMLALSSAIVGDYAIQTASTPANQLFYLNALPASTAGNWIGPITGVSVSSVNGFTGNVSLGTSNISETGGVLYYTTPRVQADAPNVTLTAAADGLLSLTGQQIGVDNQTAHFFYAGPTSGGAAAPTMRLIDVTDLPAHTHAESDVINLVTDLANKVNVGDFTAFDARYYTQGQVNANFPNVTLAGSADVLLNITGQALSLDNQTATFALMGPVSGAAAAPTFRALTTTDIPVIPDTGINFSTARNANTFFAGPSAGGAVPPLWRLIVPADLPAATTLAAGSMSAADKAKLNGLSNVINAGTIVTNYTPDASAGDVFVITLGAATVTINAPTNPVDGRKVMYRLKQDVTGSRAVAWNAVFRFGTDITSTTLTTTPSKQDYVGTVYDGTAAKWDVVSFVKGF